MHERSLVRGLLRQIERIAEQHGGGQVTGVRLCVGEFSGVDADLLQLAFEELAVETHARGAVLNVCRVPLQAQCGRCAAIFDVAGFRFVCPKCHSMEVTVVRGDELLLDSITLETAT